MIDVRPPACEYWNFQLNNHWMESLDYRYHTIALNHFGAQARPDGSVRLVVAHARPGRSELARHGGTPPRHDVPALGGREGAPGSPDARREARGRRGSRLGSDGRRRAKSIRWGEPP